jgi:hypothetical protein
VSLLCAIAKAKVSFGRSISGCLILLCAIAKAKVLGAQFQAVRFCPVTGNKSMRQFLELNLRLWNFAVHFWPGKSQVFKVLLKIKGCWMGRSQVK